MSKIKNRKGFTLLEIMVVVLIIGILLFIAFPNFIKARETSRTKSCVSNLRKIQDAKDLFAFQAPATADHVCTWEEILPFIKQKPECPGAGTYDLKTVGEPPTCTIDKHEL